MKKIVYVCVCVFFFPEMQSSPPAQVKAVTTIERDSSGASLPKASFPEELAYKNQPPCSYQQISCLDSVIRYTGYF